MVLGELWGEAKAEGNPSLGPLVRTPSPEALCSWGAEWSTPAGVVGVEG